MPVDDGGLAEGWPLDQGDDAILLLDVVHAFPPEPERHVGVAVSGGGDSVALLHLMVRACRHEGVPVSAVTVDHRLRPGSAAEAEAVAALCATLGVPHRTLVWQHGEVTGNLMEAARKVRSRLISEWARATGVTGVALGHTKDDAAESFVMGLARASGLDGLVGLRARWRAEGLHWARPLIGHLRSDLRAYLLRQGLAWVEDPSNTDARFERVRTRKALAVLSPLGINAETLDTTMLHLRLAQAALRDGLRKFAHASIEEAAGALFVDGKDFAALPFDEQRRLAVAIVRWIGGGEHPPRSTPQLRLTNALRDGRPATLGGCRFRATGTGFVALREPKAASGTVPVGTLWDHRWLIEGPPGEVRALGPKGLPQVRDWRTLGIPRDALLVTPTVWNGDTLLSAPVAGLQNGWKARIVAPFHRFAVSH